MTSTPSLDFMDFMEFDFTEYSWDDQAIPDVKSICHFKECLQNIMDNGYFCEYHDRLVRDQIHPTVPTEIIEVQPKRAKHVRTHCVVHRCGKDLITGTYLCDFHALSLEPLRVVVPYRCRVKECKTIKVYDSPYCHEHQDVKNIQC